MNRPTLSTVTTLGDFVCAKVRARLDSYLAGELSVETNHEILEHLDRCAACRAECEARERLRAAVRRVASATPGPRPGFEDEVRGLLVKTPRPSSLPAWILIAASLVAAVVLVGPRLWRTAQPTIGSAFPSARVDGGAFELVALNHLQCALKGDWPRGPVSVEQVAARLDPAFVEAFRSVAPLLTGYGVVAAHECAHGGQTFFHVIFRKDGTDGSSGLVSLAVTEKTHGSLPPAAVLEELHVRASGRGGVVILRGGNRRGFDIVGTETEHRLVFVVSSRGHDETLGIALSLLPVVVASL